MITICTNAPLKIGEIRRSGLTDAQGYPSDVAFQVISESTKEKYEQCIRDHQGVIWPEFAGALYYDVLID